MRACHQVELVTPKKFVLNGLWLGPARARRVVIWVHGLGSSMFSKLGIADHLVSRDMAVLVFNNRGHDKVSYVAKVKGKTSVRGGAAHEVFTDCADDIQGAINCAKKAGARDIYLAGHSTGCQKSMYWASTKGRGVKGVILLAPMSDYAAEIMISGKKKVVATAATARALVKKGKGNQLLPEHVWGWPLIADAQRFLSLYTPDSTEEVFLYSQPEKNPRIVRSVRIPTLVLLAEKDEYGDRPAKKIAEWFTQHIKARKSHVSVIPDVTHSFKGGERNVARVMRKWMDTLQH